MHYENGKIKGNRGVSHVNFNIFGFRHREISSAAQFSPKVRHFRPVACILAIKKIPRSIAGDCRVPNLVVASRYL